MNFYDEIDHEEHAAVLADMEAERLEAYRDAWDDDLMWSDWRERETEPEARRMVDYSDVIDPEAWLLWGYGDDHAVLIPGASS